MVDSLSISVLNVDCTLKISVSDEQMQTFGMAVSGCSMNRGAFQGEVLDQDGGSLVDQDVHALHVALEGSQVQRGASLAVPHI